MGITDLRQGDCGPTITLGACEVKLLDMTYAFSVLANNGVMKGRPVSEDLPSGYRELDPVSVLKIQDAEGNVIYQYAEPQAKQVTDPAYAYMMTHVLSRDAIEWSRLTLDRPAAAKTGTSEEFRDGVVMGYTPDLSVGVWMGNADNTPMAPGTFSSAGTGPMWRRFMNEAHAFLQLPPRPFEKPANVITSSCSGREEVFKAEAPVTKPGACKSPDPAGRPNSAADAQAPGLPAEDAGPDADPGADTRPGNACADADAPTDRVPVHGPGRGYSLQHRSEIRHEGDETSRVQRAAREPRSQARRCSQDPASGVVSAYLLVRVRQVSRGGYHGGVLA